MPLELNRHTETILGAAVEISDPGRRAAYLDDACGGDVVLRRDVERMLDDHFRAGMFLERPGPAQPATYFQPLTEHPGMQIGRYKLLEQIGEGGMGVVYVAEQTDPVRRRVALKIIKPGMDTRQVISRFEAERQALAMMDHPNIARVHDGGATDTGRPYFVMELVRGMPITEYCDKARLNPRGRLELFMTVCHAVQHAHQKGIIHRDLKPTNVLVTMQDGQPVVKVIDFGVAKAVNQSLTERTVYTAFTEMIGTPLYMSPEQAELTSLDVDTRSDVYSLGVLLYELLTGQTPFDRNTLANAGLEEVRRMIREDEPPRPSHRVSTLKADAGSTVSQKRGIDQRQLTRALAGELDWIVMKALEKDRNRRYESASAFAADIERHLNNEPVEAGPPSALYRFRKFARRRRGALVAIGFITLSVLAGVIASLWQAVEADTARKRADDERLVTERHLYAAKMNLAQQAWEDGNVRRVRELLNETAEYPDRGFEWYYWQAKTHRELMTLPGDPSLQVAAVAYAPDGQRIVTSGADGTAEIWDMNTGKLLQTLAGHKADISAVSFSSSGDRIVTGSYDQSAKIWDAASGKELLSLEGHRNHLHSAKFSPDGRSVVTASLDGSAKVWDATTGREQQSKDIGGQLRTAAFLPDGKMIVWKAIDNTAVVIELLTGRELLVLRGHAAPVRSIDITTTPRGERIVTSSYDQTAKVWDANTGADLQTLRGHASFIRRLEFSKDGARIVTAGADGMVIVWDTESGAALHVLRGHESQVAAAAFSPDGQRIVSTAAVVNVWDLTRRSEPLTLRGHRRPIRSAAVAPDGQAIVTVGEDRLVNIWDVTTGQALKTYVGHGTWITGVAASPDGARIVTASRDHTAKIWNARTGSELRTLAGHADWVSSAAFSPDGQSVVTGSGDHTVRIWNAQTGEVVNTLSGHTDVVYCVAHSPVGSLVVSGSADGTAIIWDVATGKARPPLMGHTAAIKAASFSPDGLLIVTGSDDRLAKVWDVQTGRELFTLKGHVGGVWSVSFSRDAARIVTGSAEGTAKIWDAHTGRELLTLKGHSGGVSAAAFLPDGKRIVTASGDQTAKVWEAADPEQMTAWDKDLRTAKIQQAKLQSEREASRQRTRDLRRRDPGSIRRWLILAPISFSEIPASEGAAIEALKHEHLSPEADLRPVAGQRARLADGELAWRPVEFDDYEIDFNQLLGGTVVDYTLAYAVCYIKSDTDRPGLAMHIGSDDQSKVYLNGKEVYRRAESRPFVADQETVIVDLKAGLNVVVFKVVNEENVWKGSVRFSDRDGKPLDGIQVTLHPSARGASD